MFFAEKPKKAQFFLVFVQKTKKSLEKPIKTKKNQKNLRKTKKTMFFKLWGSLFFAFVRFQIKNDDFIKFFLFF